MRAMTAGAVALLTSWTALPIHRAEDVATPAQPASRYTVIRLPDDPASHMPLIFIFDLQTARMWVLRTDGPRPYFDPVPYRKPDRNDLEDGTMEPNP